MQNYGYPVGAKVLFVETDIDRVITIGEAGVVVESFAPNNGRDVELSDGRIVNVPTFYLKDATIHPLEVQDTRRGATALMIRVVIETEYNTTTNYYGPYTPADAQTVVTAIETRHPDYDCYIEHIINHNPLFSGISNR